MKYIEELENGDVFTYNNSTYVLTHDMKMNNDRLCYSLSDGSSRWLKPDTIVTHEPIYILDSNNNIQPVKETKEKTSEKSF